MLTKVSHAVIRRKGKEHSCNCTCRFDCQNHDPMQKVVPTANNLGSLQRWYFIHRDS